MRRSLAALLVVASTAAFTVTLGSGATASTAAAISTCVAVGEPPHLRPGAGTRLYATGTFTCATAATGMRVTVCVEEQYSLTAPWWSRGCTTVSDTEPRTTVEATHTMGVPVYATFLRTTVYGTNDKGQTASFRTPPVFWFNCACYIG